jgi:hypothetical protein
VPPWIARNREKEHTLIPTLDRAPEVQLLHDIDRLFAHLDFGHVGLRFAEAPGRRLAIWPTPTRTDAYLRALGTQGGVLRRGERRAFRLSDLRARGYNPPAGTDGMRVLEYSDLEVGDLRDAFEKTVAQLEREDFASAEVKKLTPEGLFRAKLSRADRLLFRFMRYRDERCALVLEVVRNHAYDRSRFLNGAAVQEDKIPPLAPAELARGELPELAYVHPNSRRFHLLDKPLSFDDAQQRVYAAALPLVLIGSAGGGKTALALERIKAIEGDVLYATLSAYLAENARRLYHANGYANQRQNVDFLSFRECLESVRIPRGREVEFAAFREWFARHARQAPVRDAHRMYEEFKGVLTGSIVEAPWLGREDYLGLGVRQSLFAAPERPAVYELFEKYLAWLKESGRYDTNLVSHAYLAECTPRYDAVAIDEAQDLTNVQLHFLLKLLRAPGQFLLAGDANQIVHPNHFSWAKVKSLFYRDDALDGREAIHILHANYRNARSITAVANRLLRVKQARFGSIDRESNYLVDAVSEAAGSIELLPADAALMRELDRRTRRSTEFAVLVMRDEQKPAAREFFGTPLVFSVREAKGLEYPHAILFNFIAEERQAFNAVAEGVSAADLEGELRYARARDKSDKSLEAFKFFLNSLFVALTRAVHGAILVERDTAHPLLRLLGVERVAERVEVEAKASSLEDWQREAHKLELQGRNEQAEAIRSAMLHTRPTPWQPLDPARVAALAERALDPQGVSSKARRELLDYAVAHCDPALVWRLVDLGHVSGDARAIIAATRARQLQAPALRNPKEALRQSEQYGIDFRSPHNQTLLMQAAEAGNETVVRALVDAGADPLACDNYGCFAAHYALRRALGDAKYAAASFGGIYSLLAPESLSISVGGRLVKLDRRQPEYLVLNLLIATFVAKGLRMMDPGFVAGDWSEALAPFPARVVPEHWRKRAYWSGVLARNEVSRDYAYNRRLVVRVRYGRYLPNPEIKLRLADSWVPVYEHLNLPLLRRLTPDVFERVALAPEQPRRGDEPPPDAREDAAAETPAAGHGPSQARLF